MSKKKQLNKKDKLPASRLSGRFNCPYCFGVGSVILWETGGESVDCICRKKSNK